MSGNGSKYTCHLHTDGSEAVNVAEKPRMMLFWLALSISVMMLPVVEIGAGALEPQ